MLLKLPLAEIARLEQMLTTYDDASELMQLNAARTTDAASHGLSRGHQFM